MAAARYTKGFMPLSKVKEKEFLSRPMVVRVSVLVSYGTNPAKARPTSTGTKSRKKCSLL